jgi:formylglycine-generating enzyme required for sulfatase activity
VRDGETTDARFELTPKPGTVTIQCDAPGAEVFLGGERRGRAGEKLTLPALAEHTLTVRAPRHQDGTVNVLIAEPEADAGVKRVRLEEMRGPVVGQNWTSPSSGMEFVWIDALKCWVGKHEVTNGEYRKKERGHDSQAYEDHSLNGDRQPVVYVNFDDAKAYAAWLTEQDRATLGGARYRLPTEEEFMTYAQCGDGREYPWGNNWPPRSGQAGNYHGQEGAGHWDKISGYNDGHPVTCNVEQSWANPWGLYGVGGNVWEACASNTAADQSPGGWRGASWVSLSQDRLRCSFRYGLGASLRSTDVGFRVVLCR